MSAKTQETTRQIVITYSTSRGCKINLTPKQSGVLSAAGKWPRDWSGEEYATVSQGRHYGDPSCASNLVSDLMSL